METKTRDDRCKNVSWHNYKDPDQNRNVGRAGHRACIMSSPIAASSFVIEAQLNTSGLFGSGSDSCSL